MSRSTPTAEGGTLFEGRSAFQMAAFGTIQEVITAGAALTDEQGRLQRFDFFMSSEHAQLSARGEVKDQSIAMEVDQAGELRKMDFPISRAPQVNLSMESVLRRTPLAQGLTIEVPYFDPVTMSEGEMQLTVEDAEVLENGEEAWWVRSEYAGVETRSLVSSGGEYLRQESALGMSMVRMSEDEARDLPHDKEPVDLIALTAAQLKGRLPDARSRTSLDLRVTGVDPSRVMHQPPLQSLSADVVSVRIPALSELPALPVKDGSDPQWLASSATLPVADPLIRSKAREVVGEAADRQEATRRLVDFVHGYLEKVPVVGVPDGLATLKSGKGDCNEHTALFVSLARAEGIPSRIAAGLVYSEQVRPGGAFYYHAWPEVLLGDPADSARAAWVPVDPTFGQFPADATHIKLVEGDLDRQVEIMGVIGRIGFEVVAP
jgi:hypothetical protein